MYSPGHPDPSNNCTTFHIHNCAFPINNRDRLKLSMIPLLAIYRVTVSSPVLISDPRVHKDLIQNVRARAGVAAHAHSDPLDDDHRCPHGGALLATADQAHEDGQ